jgi:glycosyltransferase involved in cell wall biosynthesis
MKLIFLSTFDYPTRYAHALHGLSMARAWNKLLGDNFLFLINTTVKSEELSPIHYQTLFGPIGRRIKKLHLRSILLPFVLVWFFVHNSSWRGRGTTLFVNDPNLFWLAAFIKTLFGVRIILECHESFIRNTQADLIVFTTHAMEKNFLQHQKAKTLVLPNAVDISMFDSVVADKETLRKELALPLTHTLVGYVGRFEPQGFEKGLLTMFEALPQLPDVVLVCIGGSKKEIEEYKAHAERLGVTKQALLVPYTPHERIPSYTKACDILAYVPSATNSFFETETSPMKIFEYMASKRPIIVSDLPTIREVLDESSALFVSPGKSETFVDAVTKLRAEPVFAAALAQRAYAQVAKNTWERRARDLLTHVN